MFVRAEFLNKLLLDDILLPALPVLHLIIQISLHTDTRYIAHQDGAP